MLLRTALLTVMLQQPVWKSFSYLSLKITSEQVIKLTLSKIIRFHQGRTESSAQLQSFPLHGIITDFLQVSTFSRASILFQGERPLPTMYNTCIFPHCRVNMQQWHHLYLPLVATCERNNNNNNNNINNNNNNNNGNLQWHLHIVAICPLKKIIWIELEFGKWFLRRGKNRSTRR